MVYQEFIIKAKRKENKKISFCFTDRDVIIRLIKNDLIRDSITISSKSFPFEVKTKNINRGRKVREILKKTFSDI